MTGHSERLDGLRGIAVIGPVVHHLWPKQIPDTAYTHALLSLGGLGVDLFFVISSFLITGILLDARTKAEHEGRRRRSILLPFFVRRVLRIWPLYFTVLALLWSFRHPEIRSHGTWYILFLANFRIWDLGTCPHR